MKPKIDHPAPGTTDSAKSIAARYGLNEKYYRAALRKRSFEWHVKHKRWDVIVESGEWKQMIQVAEELSSRQHH